MRRMKYWVTVTLLLAASATTALALPYWQVGELAGTTDWAGDARFRNFNTTISDYEMMVNASPTRTVGQNQVNGDVPGPYAFADWAQHNDFWLTYDPGANSMSLRLLGSGPRALGTPGGYDITIGRAPDAVANPVNYINFQLWDRVNFPTFPNGLTISSLDGQNIGTFTIPAAGIGSWSILDGGSGVLGNGFILQGSFDLDLTKLAEGREGDKIIFGFGYNLNGNAPEIPEPGSLVFVGLGLLGVAELRRRLRK